VPSLFTDFVYNFVHQFCSEGK